MSWREWMRSYLLAGRIAAGILQSRPEGRLPDAYALTRIHRATQHRLDAAEVVGRIVITLPLELDKPAISDGKRPWSGATPEDPFGLPHLDRRR